MEECFPSAMRDYDSRPVLDFICGVLSKNNNTGCYIPEDVYREDCECAIVITFIYCVYSTTFLCIVVGCTTQLLFTFCVLH